MRFGNPRHKAVLICAFLIVIVHEMDGNGSLFADDFLRGDANVDEEINIADAQYILGCLFLGSACPTCQKAVDANGDDGVNLGDAVFILNFLFLADLHASILY